MDTSNTSNFYHYEYIDPSTVDPNKQSKFQKSSHIRQYNMTSYKIVGNLASNTH